MTAAVEHYIHNGLRKIKPYHHTATTFVKGRWFDRTILEVLTSEFKTRDRAFYHSEIMNDHVVIGREDVILKGSVLMDLKLQNKDKLTMTTHKHEPSVLAFDSIPIVYEDDKLLVVNKPSSIPIHPTARYFNNTLTEILKEQAGLKGVHPCHRLDKLTSGTVILAKDTKTANLIQSKIQMNSESHTVQKTYLARVKGKFPFTEPYEHSKPISTIDVKKGFVNGIKDAKPAVTVFKLWKYDPVTDESIVWCEPKTGRTHQIRVHLWGLGYPIVNDPLYGVDCSEFRSSLMKSSLKTTDEEEIERRLQFELLERESKKNINDLLTGGKCEVCGEAQFKDPVLSELVLCLHAFKYVIKFDADTVIQSIGTKEGNVWCFETDVPEWANIE